MLILMKILFIHSITWIHSQKHIDISADKQHELDIEPLIVNIRIGEMDSCRKSSDENCRNLIKQLLQCEQIIFTDSSFHSSHYDENLIRHKEILSKYQSLCDDTTSDYLIDDLFDFK